MYAGIFSGNAYGHCAFQRTHAVELIDAVRNAVYHYNITRTLVLNARRVFIPSPHGEGIRLVFLALGDEMQ